MTEVAALAAAVARLPRLQLRGLMCMLPEGLESAQQIKRFVAISALQDRLNRAGARLDTLSMGMSSDYASAIAAGSTMVRIGTALFGARATPAAQQQEL
jgi:uncharacterized pyridoxal phosphate-containing UPF0001 family protein